MFELLHLAFHLRNQEAKSTYSGDKGQDVFIKTDSWAFLHGWKGRTSIVMHTAWRTGVTK